MSFAHYQKSIFKYVSIQATIHPTLVFGCAIFFLKFGAFYVRRTSTIMLWIQLLVQVLVQLLVQVLFAFTLIYAATRHFGISW
jgi:hypothetical protein